MYKCIYSSAMLCIVRVCTSVSARSGSVACLHPPHNTNERTQRGGEGVRILFSWPYFTKVFDGFSSMARACRAAKVTVVCSVFLCEMSRTQQELDFVFFPSQPSLHVLVILLFSPSLCACVCVCAREAFAAHLQPLHIKKKIMRLHKCRISII